MDKWKDIELEKMKIGGNRKAKEFFESQSDYREGMSLNDKYNTRAAALYRDKIATEADGKQWSIETSSAKNFKSFQPYSTNLTTSASYPRLSDHNNFSRGEHSTYQTSGIGHSNEDIRKQKDEFFDRIQNQNASRPADLPPSQGGRYAGFGNTPLPQKNENDFLQNLSMGWSSFTTGASKIASMASEKAVQAAHVAKEKTKELSQTVNESVIQPTREKVKEGTLLNEVGQSMSGFASKLQSVGAKGWGNLQSLWGEPKTTLSSVDTSPGEKSSLLGGGGAAKDRDPSKGQLLGDDDDSWEGWGGDWQDKGSKRGDTSPSKEEEDFEAWLNEDSSPKSSSKDSSSKDDEWGNWGTGDNGASKKAQKSVKNMKKKEKQAASEGWNDVEWNDGHSTKKSKESKEPLVGNLVDLGDNSTGGQGDGSGWDNEVWADADDDEWQTLELDNSKANKLK
ncbi:hypothetical protein CHS0354_019452 [Potamilus streckersoni]|uniref:ADP-ribosylation factor GTPase-activating protein 1 n=1 Tax=Potamilus streckersoni TaxID=2493646 RepID=A0AAE0SHK5_9BIVA|nr:hypothetical protein CHS0354_019452 [Potamilus streckersoni]